MQMIALRTSRERGDKHSIRSQPSPQTTIAQAGAGLCLSLLLLPLEAAQATTLRDALSAAYRANPRLEAERARLRATDEDVPRARAGWQPNVSTTLHAGYQDSETRPGLNNGHSHPYGIDVALSQPIFTGFRTINRVRVAEANVRAGRANLRGVEQDVFLAVVRAYADIVRDQKIVGFRQRNLGLINRQLSATRQRLALQEVTQTDLSQVQARQASAKAQLALARANLRASRATYRRVVGQAPHGIRHLHAPHRTLPRSSARAIHLALHEHPSIVQSLFLEAAARHTVNTIRGEFLPAARVEVRHSKVLEPSRLTRRSDSTVVRAEVNVPLYQGGEVAARVRQAKHLHVSRLQEVERERKAARERAATAYSQLLATRAAVRAGRLAVAANRRALGGVREEETVGQRTILDVLNAQLELLNAQIQLTIDARNEVVAAYTLLAAVGRFDVTNIKVAEVVYDPTIHYQEVRHERWRTNITHERRRVYPAPHKLGGWGAKVRTQATWGTQVRRRKR